MTDSERTWRDAKLPQWVRDSIAEELDRNALRAALAWPAEAKPEPAPFRWGDYDRLVTGKVEPGTYWQADRSYSSTHVRRIDIEPDQWRWIFTVDGRKTSDVQRGPLYYSARDALLALLWDECTAAAKRLQAISDKIKGAGQ